MTRARGVRGRLYLVGTMVMGVTACSATTDLSDIVVVEMAVSDATVSADAQVTIRVTVVNRGAESIEVDPSTCPEAFDVLGVDGQQVGPPLAFCSLVFLPPQSLRPGETLEFNHTWDGAGNVGEINQREALPLGVYLLRGRASVVGHGVVFSGLTLIDVVALEEAP